MTGGQPFSLLVSVLSAEADSDWEAYFNTGMTWGPAPTWQLDGGIRVGLTRLRGLEGGMGREALILRDRGQKVGTTGFS